MSKEKDEGGLMYQQLRKFINVIVGILWIYIEIELYQTIQERILGWNLGTEKRKGVSHQTGR